MGVGFWGAIAFSKIRGVPARVAEYIILRKDEEVKKSISSK